MCVWGAKTKNKKTAYLPFCPHVEASLQSLLQNLLKPPPFISAHAVHLQITSKQFMDVTYAQRVMLYCSFFYPKNNNRNLNQLKIDEGAFLKKIRTSLKKVSRTKVNKQMNKKMIITKHCNPKNSSNYPKPHLSKLEFVGRHCCSKTLTSSLSNSCPCPNINDSFYCFLQVWCEWNVYKCTKTV